MTEQTELIPVNEHFDADDAESFDGVQFSEPVEPFQLCEIIPKPGGNGFFAMRPYQADVVRAVYDSWQRYTSTLVVLPTGTGKTVCFAEIAAIWPDELGRVLIVAHREELIDQAAEKVGLHDDRETGIEMGERRETRNSLFHRTKVLVASIQTLSRVNRRKHHLEGEFGCLVYDEAHHSSSASYREVMEHYLVLNPQLRVLGVTASPNRADGKALGDIYQNVSYEMSLLEGIEQGWLVDVKQKVVVIDGLDFSKCRTTGGDLNQKDLASTMMGGVDHKVEAEEGVLTPLQQEEIEQQEKMLHAVAVPTIKEAAGRPTLVFCVTKAHAERMCEIFSRYPGVKAEFITDDTHKDDRKRIINQFKARQIQILCNVGVLLEGFDSRVDVVAMARPTKSHTVYYQAIGRGTRPIPNLVDQYPTAQERRDAILASEKPYVTVLDFCGNSGRHNLLTAVDALAGEYEQDVIEAAKARMRAGDTAVVSDLLEQLKEELDEQKRQQAMEKAERDRLQRERADLEREQRRLEALKREKIRADVAYRTEEVVIGATIPETIGVDCFRGGATDSQVRYLMRLGVTHEKACAMSRGQAGTVIDKLQSLTGGEFRMRFGKYLGVAINKIPSGYLDWAANSINDAVFQQNLKQFRTERVV